MKWDTVIFDMDGTLFDTEKIGYLSWKAYGEKYHYDVVDEMILQVFGRTKQSAMPIFRKYFPDDWDIDECYRFRDQFKHEYKEKYGPLPKTDLNRLLTTIKNMGYRLAICSSTRREIIDYNLAFDDLEHYFDVIVDGTMSKRGKPYPDIYRITANKLNVEPNKCLVIEDSKSGILAAHKAGMDVIMVVDKIQPDDELKQICMKIYYQLDDILEILK